MSGSTRKHTTTASKHQETDWKVKRTVSLPSGRLLSHL